MAADSYPLPKPAKQIGTPYGGGDPNSTHSKAFNKARGSDNWESENAYDLATPAGTPVYAVSNGTIGKQIGSLGSGGRFAGLRLHLVTHGNEYYYAHLSKLVVKAGETVHAGQLLGYSGVANGVAHLHFAAKYGDPAAVFSGGYPTQTPAGTGQASADTSGSVAGTGGGQPASGIVPPVAAAPPTALQGVTGGDVQMPGSVSYTIDPSHVVSLWQQAATGDMVSPETQQLMSNALLASGGGNAGGQG